MSYRGYLTRAEMKQASKTFRGSLSLVLRRAPDVRGQWVGHCLDFDVVSQGDSPQQALEMTMEAVVIVIGEDLVREADPYERRAPVEAWEEFFRVRAKGGLIRSLKHVRPTSVFAVPVQLDLRVTPELKPDFTSVPAWVLDRPSGTRPAHR